MIARIWRTLRALNLRWTLANLDTEIVTLQHDMARDLAVLNMLSMFDDHSAVLTLRCAEDRQLLARLQMKRNKLQGQQMQFSRWGRA